MYVYLYARGIRGEADGMATTSPDFFRDGRDVLLVFPSATFCRRRDEGGFCFSGWRTPGEIINY